VERGEIASAASGRHHGLLHSGARYALTDLESARECIQENTILRRIAPGAFELNDGLFVAITEEDLALREAFLAGCEAAGIPARPLSPQGALRREPNLNPNLLAAVQVPDGTCDAWRLVARFLASARAAGAEVRPYHEVVDVLVQAGRVTGVEVQDHTRQRTYRLEADLVVNAAGPWAGQIAAMAGVGVPGRDGGRGGPLHPHGGQPPSEARGRRHHRPPTPLLPHRDHGLVRGRPGPGGDAPGPCGEDAAAGGGTGTGGGPGPLQGRLVGRAAAGGGRRRGGRPGTEPHLPLC
ncbi:MAG: FAD-dependent oxidoreductase, partial [Anaerolineae bacterium]|nr:FAD-dependent oxidoreductase [Anaerolineae bacterium]